jgi:ABC-type polysaccharide/polyol phosphate export permease
VTTPSQTRPYAYHSAHLGPLAIRELLELFRYRDLLGLLIVKNITTRYKRSALGVVWTLLNPVLNTLVLTVAFSALFQSTIAHYPVYVLAGLLVWNFFTQPTLNAMNTLVWGSSLIKRVYIPRTIFAVSAVGTGLVNFGLALIPLAGVMLVVGHPFYPTWWFVPIAIGLVAVFFVDVVDIYQVVIQAGFFLTPIMYPSSIMPPQFAWLVPINPIYNLVQLFRAPIYDGSLPSLQTFLVASLWALGVLLIGWLFFTWRADEFAYRI